MSGVLSNLYDNVSYSLAIHSQEMLRLQEETATGSRINRISDNPSVAHHLMVLDSQQSSTHNYIENLNTVVNTFEMTTSTVQSINDELIKTKELLTQIAGGIYGEENRNRVGDGLDDHLEQLVQLANAQHTGEYLFGGDKTGAPPYTVTRNSDGRIASVTYQGSEDERTVQTAPGVETDVFLVGPDIFQSNDRGTPDFITESTGAILPSSPGTANVTGDVWLTVTHNGTSFELSIDDGATTVDLASVSDTSNVAVTNANGKVIYIDASSADLTTGTDLISIPGTYNMFDTIISARDLLYNTHNLPEHQLNEAIQSSANAISEVNELVLQSNVSLGLTSGFLYDLQATLEDAQANTKEESDTLSEVDIAQVAIDLSRRQVLYEMSLSVAGKLMQVSLLDYIR